MNELLFRGKGTAAEKKFLDGHAAQIHPLRDRLLSSEEMEAFGRRLAEDHRLAPRIARNKLTQQLEENKKTLAEVWELLSAYLRAGHRLSPAAAWLLDNFYLIHDQVNKAGVQAAKTYVSELPVLLHAGTPMPRLLDMATRLVAHTDGQVSPDMLAGFVNAYQQISFLDLRELHAMQDVLRLVLIDNLCRLAVRIARAQILSQHAGHFAQHILSAGEHAPARTADILQQVPRDTDLTLAMLHRLREQAGSLPPGLLQETEQRLTGLVPDGDDGLRMAQRRQAADRVSLRNNLSSLRIIGTTDWRDFIRHTSIVDKLLRGDAAGIYEQMDYYSRDACCRKVEKIARQSRHAEAEMARLALQMAREGAMQHGPHHVSAHVGYYLQGAGYAQLKKRAKVPETVMRRLAGLIRRFRLAVYLGSMLIVALLITWLLTGKAMATGGWLLVPVMICSAIVASQVAVTFVNSMASYWVNPFPLPRLDFSRGIPPDARTLVVVPVIAGSVEEVDAMIAALEVRYLGNRDPHLHFALLTDFKDAPAATMPEDEPILRRAKEKTEALNQRYAKENGSFYLFHRPRRWNAAEGVWMGYERKRGKLSQLNALLRGRGKENFSLIAGNMDLLPAIRYVITLDADTHLPRDAAWKLAGTIAHPLNRPVYDTEKKRVVAGYGVLQPRISLNLAETDRSLYVRMQGDTSGIDPYTRVTSDVYQDLFGEGSFIGKGIYDVDIFDNVLNGRFPENRILSHDLLEGCFIRSGFVSDVQLFEDHPAGYFTDTRRHHRWIRGDWQTARFLLPLVRNERGVRQRNTLSALSRWKIFDNLRRSFVPASSLLLLVLGWTALNDPIFWTVSMIVAVMFPALIAFAGGILKTPRKIFSARQWLRTSAAAGYSFMQSLYAIANLPYEAWYTLDAIVRTGWRLLVTRRKLLEWNPSGSREHKQTISLRGMYRLLWISPLLALALIVGFMTTRQTVPFVAAPFLLCWLTAPCLAWWVSKRPVIATHALDPQQPAFLHGLARKTWSFFEQFTGEHDHWLPPDYYQEYPVKRISHRTSPTNMGLALLANLAAHDFGYIGTGRFIERTSRTLQAMKQLERYKGHFYNWYDTHSLKPVHPKYVSTVDSANLAGHLLVLRQGITEIFETPVIGPETFCGIRDTYYLLLEVAPDTSLLTTFSNALQHYQDAPPTNLYDAADRLTQLTSEAVRIIAELQGGDHDVLRRAEAVHAQCVHALEELQQHAPWVMLPASPARFTTMNGLHEIPTLRELAVLDDALRPALQQLAEAGLTAEEEAWLGSFRQCLADGVRTANEQISLLKQIHDDCAVLADMDFEFLYNKPMQLLAIGYNVSKDYRDTGCYDLLASEARVATFVAIAQGKLPQDSWFAMGRPLVQIEEGLALQSWSGSMFEYLMPQLVMPSYANSLLHIAAETAVRRQIAYGRRQQVPWGISECAYSEIDINLAYQYGPAGVPGLGLQRGLDEQLVIAPYASMLALMVDPGEACANLQRLAAEGYMGKYGFYEAIDFTKSRLPRGKEQELVRSFMMHHQSMGFLALAYCLLDKPMQKRFEAEPAFAATLMLLQEPPGGEISTAMPDAGAAMAAPEPAPDAVEAPETAIVRTPHTPAPEVQLMSNGRYHVMITSSGGGYSRWKDISVTRWREDATCDQRGMFCYIRDVESNISWSGAWHPLASAGVEYEAAFMPGIASFSRRDAGLATATQIAVSPEDDIEIRRVTIRNNTPEIKVLEITSYAEVVLAPAADDAWHPAFGNLFVQTAIDPLTHTIFARRRPRSVQKQPPSLFHLMKVYGGTKHSVSYETDRLRFIGRGNTVLCPQALTQPLSNSEGPVLDPIVSIRYRITVDPGCAVTADMLLGVGENEAACRQLAGKYQERQAADRLFELAATHGKAVLKRLRISGSEEQLFRRMAGPVIYSSPACRAERSVIMRNRLGQQALWNYSISGDLPLVLLRIADPANIALVEQLVKACSWWHLKGLAADLVIWNENKSSYRQFLDAHIREMAAGFAGTESGGRSGGIFVMNPDDLPAEDQILIQTVARLVIGDEQGLPAWVVMHPAEIVYPIPLLSPVRTYCPAPAAALPLPRLLFFNGTGGFTENGQEYVMALDRHQRTPMPWANVLANAGFGTVVSESGQSYTWAGNAQEFRLTPWHNDPVCDTSGEVFYLRDEEDGHYWSPAPLPTPGSGRYITRHGFGYSLFETIEHGIYSAMRLFADLEAPVKFTILKIQNRSAAARRISVTGYVEWVLGTVPHQSARHVITQQDAATGALFAINPYNIPFAQTTCFFDVDAAEKTVTTDRTEFIGRNGSLASPEAMRRIRLSGNTHSMADPCAALQAFIELPPGAEWQLVFVLGAGSNAEDASRLLKQCREAGMAEQALARVQRYWRQTLGAVQVHTPDAAVNIMANGWLLYQTLACRLWARSGYYQSGGAFGFRDQLQDVMALVHAQPALARKHILLCASRQFEEGNVQHWWHPGSGHGLQTNCSDDYLWLPYVTCHYINTTGDMAILDERVPFLGGGRLKAGEDSHFGVFQPSSTVASLYTHCVRAIRHAQARGVHGLPLMGSGDWNDGMDHVGHEGRGESVWVAFFLFHILNRFAGVATEYDDASFATWCREQAEGLRQNIEASAWDGNWYLRAWFDDGTPLGSHTSEECRIDSISQSWSVLSGAGSAKRCRSALDAAWKYLVRKEHALIQLLDPPFDRAKGSPGYIKGYLPGVRENGGQYTHAAIWLVMAFAEQGDSRRVAELLQMINPVYHADTPEKISVYKAEPYVMAADVYWVPPHSGRGGWSWYTGSAAWMYRLILESVLGLRREGNRLLLKPCVPWDAFRVHYRYGKAIYCIEVQQVTPAKPWYLLTDGILQVKPEIQLVDDGRKHWVKIIGRQAPALTQATALDRYTS